MDWAMGKPNPTRPKPVLNTATRTRSRGRSPGRSDARFRAGSPGRDAPRSRGWRSRPRRISSAVLRSARATSPRTLPATSPLHMRRQPVNESVGSIRGMPATTAQTSSAPALAVASPAASEILLDRRGASRMPLASRPSIAVPKLLGEPRPSALRRTRHSKGAERKGAEGARSPAGKPLAPPGVLTCDLFGYFWY